MVTRLLRLAEPPRPADAADALALAICHLWRGGAQARLAAAARRPGGGARPRHGHGSGRNGGDGGEPMIAHLDGVVTTVAPEGAVIDVGGSRAARAVLAGHAGRPAARGAGQGGHLAGGPRGRADPVRVRQRRRAQHVRAAADRQRHRAAAGAGDAGHVQPGRAAPRGRRRGPDRADQRAGHRAQGRSADRARTGRPARVARRAGHAGAGSALPAPRPGPDEPPPAAS